jgi:hypothetical protein
MRKANTISYEMEHQYALYAYYSQLAPWINAYNHFPTVNHHQGEYLLQPEQNN